jgi:hypothetical protein
MYDIPFDRSFFQLSNGIRHVMPSTDRKLELTAKASMAQPVSQPAVYASGLINYQNCEFVGLLYMQNTKMVQMYCTWLKDFRHSTMI